MLKLKFKVVGAGHAVASSCCECVTQCERHGEPRAVNGAGPAVTQCHRGTATGTGKGSIAASGSLPRAASLPPSLAVTEHWHSVTQRLALWHSLPVSATLAGCGTPVMAEEVTCAVTGTPCRSPALARAVAVRVRSVVLHRQLGVIPWAREPLRISKQWRTRGPIR